MSEEISYTLSNEFDKEVITFNTITCLRLFDLGNDAAVLYLFYVKTSKIQGTNTVKALNCFCKKGLGWGSYRFNKAKKLLIDNGLIETVIRRDENNVITGNYMRIHYIKGSLCDVKKPNKITTDTPTRKTGGATLRVEPPCGCEETNAINKKENTINKKENASNKNKNTKYILFSEKERKLIDKELKNKPSDNFEDIEKIFLFWNTQNIVKHQFLNLTTETNIKNALDNHSVNEIIQSIKNYKYVCT